MTSILLAASASLSQGARRREPRNAVLELPRGIHHRPLSRHEPGRLLHASGSSFASQDLEIQQDQSWSLWRIQGSSLLKEQPRPHATPPTDFTHHLIHKPTARCANFTENPVPDLQPHYLTLLNRFPRTPKTIPKKQSPRKAYSRGFHVSVAPPSHGPWTKGCF